MAFVNKIAGKKIVIIGGSSGIGYGVAEAVVSLDAKVWIASSSEERVSKAVAQLKKSFPAQQNNVHGLTVDVGDTDKLIATLQKLAPIDHLIYSAVDSPVRKSLDELELKVLKEAFDIKFWGAVTSGITASKHDIIRPGGSLTLTSGTAGLKPGKNSTVWGGLNGAVISLTHGLAFELSPKQIRVNTVIPGIVDTELWQKLVPDEEERKAALEGSKKKLLVPFIGLPKDIAEAYIYLIRADYSTGQTIIIDGGGLYA